MPRPIHSRSPAVPRAETARRINASFKFEFEPYHRNVPDEQLLDDLREVAQKLNVQTMSQAVYRRHSRFTPLTLAARFGGWNEALAKAGLRPSRHFRVPAETVLADIVGVARQLKTNHLLLTQYEFAGRFSMPVIYRHFGNWQGALTAAGLASSTYRPRTTDQNLFDNLEQLWRTLGRQPKCTELTPPQSRFGLTPYQRRFGGYQAALNAFIDWKAQHPNNSIKTSRSSSSMAIIHHKTTRTITWRLRYLILRRDHFRCRACGRSPANEPAVKLEVDHIHPWRHGGETLPDNLQTLCETCNRGKSDLPWKGNCPAQPDAV